MCGSVPRNGDGVDDEVKNDDYLGLADPWDHLLPRQMNALDLRSAANDHEDLTRIRRNDAWERDPFLTQSTSHSRHDGSTWGESPSRRWRTCYAPSPETPVQFDLGLGMSNWSTRSLDGSHDLFIGKTPSRVCSPPGVKPDISPIKTPKSTDISIHLDEWPSPRASDVSTPGRDVYDNIEQGSNGAMGTPGSRSLGTSQWNPYNATDDDPNTHQDSRVRRLETTVFQDLAPTQEGRQSDNARSPYSSTSRDWLCESCSREKQ